MRVKLSSNYAQTIQKPDFVGRITTVEWREILLNKWDEYPYNGSMWLIKVKKMGFGVLELYSERKYPCSPNHNV